MIKSMTGFGKTSLELSQYKITIEIKSLNSKSLDLNLRIPSLYREKELEIRKLISEQLQRGKIDLIITQEFNSGVSVAQINAQVVQSYIEQLQAIVPGNQTELLKMAIRMPDSLNTPVEEISGQDYLLIINSLQKAIDELISFRSQEGDALKIDFQQRIQNIEQYLSEIQLMDVERLCAVRNRLDKSIAEIRDRFDENRFEQELIFYLEKLDITEEIVRLKNHLHYFIQTLNQLEPSGRKLGFICQEIGREINTMGSKANYAPMQKIVVQMKDELEKIKEQVLNVL